MALTRNERANVALFQSKIFGGNLNKAYFTHGVMYGNYFDLRIYKDVKFTFKHGNNQNHLREKDGDKRYDSIARSKVKVYRLVCGNNYQHGRFRPLFATYTFAEPVEGLDTALGFFRRYLRRLERHLGYKVKYVAVPQIQWERYEKTGKKVWHFHIVFFNVPPLNFKINDHMWGQGGVNIQFVKGIKNIGAYVAGYCTKKDIDEIPFNRRFYYCSRGLFHPQDFFHKDVIDSLLLTGTVKVLKVFEGVKYSQIKYQLK